MEIGVIGNDLFTIGFRLVGIEKWFNVSEEVPVDDAIKAALQDKEIGVLVIHDEDWKEVEASLRKKLSNSVKPTVIAIGAEVDEGLRDRIKTAVGVDLWK
jgi:V/A-type H+-transporting ATPase subunit F